MKCQKCGDETISLTELADKKNCYIEINKRVLIDSQKMIYKWCIGIYMGDARQMPSFYEDLYSEVEQKARQYLESLRDGG